MRYAVCGMLAMLSAVTAAQSSVQDARFDVVSVKPITAQAAAGRSYRAPPGSFTSALSIAALVPLAYQLDSYRVVGLPAWTVTDLYEINAKTPAVRQSGDLWPMVRHLLEERFALRVHREIRPMPVYALVRMRADGKLGPDLRPVTRACDTKAVDIAERCYTTEYLGTYSTMGARWENVRRMIEALSGRPIVDETGLSGQFDAKLEWNPELTRIPDGINGVSLADLETRPTFVTAIREQLGLRLESRTAPIEVLVIDSIERPKSGYSTQATRSPFACCECARKR